MPKSTPHLLLALAVALLASCSGSPPESGSAQFAVAVRQALATEISRVSVTSSAADIPSVSVNLALSNGMWGGIIGNIPAGTNRSFHAQAFNASGTLLFEGSASGVTIVSNKSTLVAITLQQATPPPPFQNEAPLLGSLVASSTTVSAGDSISLVVTAHDPNAGDTLSYAWSATAGTFSTPAALSTSWKAPASTGIQMLTFTVTDAGGLASSITLAINVTRSEGEGDAQLNISFNSFPNVSAMRATPTQLAPGQTISVSASASDPDGDDLSYAWSATCAGSWTNATSSTAAFSPSALPAGACNNCKLSVRVSDSRGGQTTGTVAVCIASLDTNRFPPTIIRAYQSAHTARPSQQLTFEIVASDPQSSSLTFSWSVSTGALGMPQNNANTSRIVWTAPTCVSASTPATITATVTNAYGLPTTKTFGVTGLPTCAAPGWASTGSMAAARYLHTETLLPNGKVLVAGGSNSSGALASAEVYDPVTGTWASTGTMLTARHSHTATLLPNGRVLVTGGAPDGANAFASAEVYDPSTGTWTPTNSMAFARRSATTTLLPNGKVLVAGGHSGSGNYLASTEVYDPATGAWSSTGSMNTLRGGHTATLLSNGLLLVSGGLTFNSASTETAELYDPSIGSWSPTSAMTSRRSSHRATLLSNGKVVISGGFPLATVEIYDPTTGSWSPAGSMSSARASSTATLLPNGKILVAGGQGSGGILALATAEVYDPVTNSWSSAGSMASARLSPKATLLPNGKVLVTGGHDGGSHLATAEVYTPE